MPSSTPKPEFGPISEVLRLRTPLVAALAVAILLGLFWWPPAGHGIEWPRYAVGILLVYGTAFIVLGLICFVVPSMPLWPLSVHLHWFGAFALLHGSKELFEAWALATGQAAVDASGLEVMWQMASFLALFEFSRRLWRGDGSSPVTPSAWLLSPWLYGLLALLTAVLGFAWGVLPAVHIAASCLVALPGAALAAAWLWMCAKRVSLSEGASTTLALALGTFALLSGAVVDSVAGLPAWLPTAVDFDAAAGVPVHLLRALCAVVAALTLSRLAMLHLVEVAAQAERNATDLAVQVEQKTRSNALAQKALDSAQDAIAIADADGSITYVNASFLKAWGYRDTTMVLGTHVTAHWQLPGPAYKVVDRRLGQDGRWEGDLEVLRGDGCTVPMRVVAVLVRERDGSRIAMMATFHDLTEIRRAQRAEREQRVFNEAIVEHAGTMVLVLDADGRIVRFNRACEAVSGRSSDEVVGRYPRDLLLPPERAEAVRQDAFVALKYQPQRLAGRHVDEWLAADGRRALIDWNTTLLFDEERRVSHMVSVGVDITERQRGEAALAQSEQRLNEAQRLAQVGSWELDLGTGKLLWSDEIFRIFEIDRARFAASYEAFLGAVHPEDREAVGTAYERSLADRLPYSMEHRLLMLDGRVKWVQELGVSEFDTEGKPLRSLGTVQDITERILAQQSLWEAQALLAEAQKLARLGNWIFDPPNGTTLWSTEQYRLLGYEPEAVEAGMPNYLRAVHPEDRHAVQDALQRAVEPGSEGEFHIEHRVRVREGERYLELRGRACFDTSGRAVRLFGTSMDISERRLRELELETRRAQLEALVHTRTGELEMQSVRNALILGTAIDGFFTTNTMTRIVEVNPAYCRMLGYSRDELLARSMADIEAKLDPEQVMVRAATIRRRGHARFETRQRRKDGSLVDVEVSLNSVDLAGEQFCFGFVRDITDRRRSERALRVARDEAEQASRAKTDFMSGMSHELRTPMNAILGFSQLLRMQTLSAEQLDAAGEIYSAGQHLLSLIDDLLDLTRIEAGKLAVVAVPVNVAGVAAEALRIVKSMVSAHGLALSSNLPEGLSVQADPVRLRQVLVNLLSNAAKYNRSGGRVSIDAQAAGPQRLRLLVSDTGPGIAPELLPRLFKTFERLGAEHSGVEGSGIGLALSKHLAERMGGNLGVETHVGEGSTFWIELPLAAAVLDAAAGAAQQTGLAALAAPFEVLYIEDNRANQKVVELTFKTRPDWRLRTATTGPEGLELARGAVPDAILLDIHLPGMDGYAVLQALRADPRTASVPVVALSADAMRPQIERGLRAGFYGYLAKPLDLERLLAMMSTLAAAACH